MQAVQRKWKSAVAINVAKHARVYVFGHIDMKIIQQSHSSTLHCGWYQLNLNWSSIGWSNNRGSCVPEEFFSLSKLTASSWHLKFTEPKCLLIVFFWRTWFAAQKRLTRSILTFSYVRPLIYQNYINSSTHTRPESANRSQFSADSFLWKHPGP